MKWFRNLKTSVKLVSCFIILAIFTAVVGIIGITNMSNINKRAVDMYENNFIPVIALTTIQKNLLLIRSNFFLMVYEKDMTKFPQRTEEINKYTQEDNDLLKEYEKSIQSDKDKGLYSKVTDSLVLYRKLRAEIIKSVQEQKFAEATANIPEFDQAREKVDEAVGDLIKFNETNSKEKSQKNASEYSTQAFMMILIILISMVFAITLGLIIANIISKPLHKLVSRANQIAAGDLNVAVDIDTKDEVGILAKSFFAMAENLNDVIGNINSAAEQVASGAKQVSDSSMALSQGATEQASAVEELTSSLQEIASQTRQNADSANQANVLAEATRVNAVAGNEEMNKMIKAMDEINESSSKISRIIKVIDEIAFQTNILALNAAVEAARAGQYGKGFAVVAEEVRNLAARSADAAKETTDMIEGSIKKVESGTKIANQTAESLSKIVNDITRISSLVDNIATSSNEQASGISQVSQGIAQVSSVVQITSATSEESAATSEELASQASFLKDQVSMFKLKGNNFASSYRRREDIDSNIIRMLDSTSEKSKTACNKYEKQW